MRSSPSTPLGDLPIVTVTVVRAGHPKVRCTVAAATPNDLLDVLAESNSLRLDLSRYHVKILYKGKNIKLEDDNVVFADGSKVTCMLSSKASTDARDTESFPILGEFAEKEKVLYFDKRRGEYIDAMITGVDRTIIPHSYTINLYEQGFDQDPTSVDRETEASRLSKKA